MVRDGVRVPEREVVEADLRLAARALDANQPKQARAILERTRAEAPQSRRGDEVLFALGEIYRRQGERERAIATWRELVSTHPKSARQTEVRLRLAALYREAGRPTLAREVLAGAPFERASDAERARGYRELAVLSRELSDWPETLRWLAFARREATTPEETAALDAEIDELLQERLLESELERLAPDLPPGSARDRVHLELARRALARGEGARALAALDALPRGMRPADDEQRERLLAEAERGSGSALRELGVVLPLSGAYESFGRSVLRGVALGFGTFDDPPGPYALLVRDSAGDPERAAAAVRALAAEGVRAIIGPVRSAEAASAAPEAHLAGVPLLTLAQREDIPHLGEVVFRLGLTASDQVRALVDFAVARRGARRFAVLYPRDDYGAQFKNLFWEEVERQGGEIVACEGYTPGVADLQAEIKKLVGLGYLTDAERKLLAERDTLRRRAAENAGKLAAPPYSELPPYVDFDALFVPDAAAQVGLVLPQLRFFEIREPLLLGTSAWNDVALLERAAREARGAVFTDAFFAHSSYPFVQEFVQRYYAAYGVQPDAQAAQAFDAATLLRAQLDTRGRASREDVRRALADVRDFAGVSGLTSLGDGGGTRKALYLLTVRGGAIEELDDSP